VFKDVECYFRTVLGVRLLGTLNATTYAISFVPTGPLPASLRHLHASFFRAPVAALRSIDKSTPRGREAGSAFFVDLAFKDVRAWTLGFREEAMADKVVSHLRLVAWPSKMDFLHAFAEGGTPLPPALATSAPGGHGWEVYNPYTELERLGVLSLRHPRTGELLWRVSDVNREYAYCPTYPAVLVFPERVSDGHLAAIAGFRSKARVPALTWCHPVTKTTLWRCSQPRVGMTNNACREDEWLFACIRDANLYSRDPAAPLLIADCRPRANAYAQKAGGWGFENYAIAQLEFLGIHNIHAVRDAYKKLEALALSPATSDTTWSAQVSDSGWPYHVRTLLSASLFVADCMHRRGQSVVVHCRCDWKRGGGGRPRLHLRRRSRTLRPARSVCSDGWDRTAQVCGLVQVLLDPYSRTLKGFASLVAKEWASFGHKFQERLGHGNDKGYDYHESSPILLQWLDAVYQLVTQFPAAFEFNTRTLLLIAHHAYSCRFGNFLFDCERERAEAKLSTRTPSLWGYLLHPDRVAACLNPAFNPSAGDVLLPHPSTVLRHVTLWSEWFLRWAPFPSLTHASARMEQYPVAAYDHAALARVHVPRQAAPAGNGAGVPDSTSPSVSAARPPVTSAASTGGFTPPVPDAPGVDGDGVDAAPSPLGAGVGLSGPLSARSSPVVVGEGEEEEEEEGEDGAVDKGAGRSVDLADAAMAHAIASAAASGRSSVVGGLGLGLAGAALAALSVPAADSGVGGGASGAANGNGAGSHPPAPLDGEDAEAMVPTSTFLPSADMDGDLAGGEGDALPGSGGGATVPAHLDDD